MRFFLKKYSAIIFSLLLMFHIGSSSAYALFDPLSRPNNMYGMHILFDHELSDAASLINSNGGEWGYVTIPIQMGDYDLQKWQRFMDDARSKKLIPLVRLMTDPYWANTHVWRKPKTMDIIDMANFLNSLNWPIENRYIIVFNEMNRYDEWGGEYPNPEEYADILDTTISIFKERNQDFYMIMGGLDNAAPNDSQHMASFTYLERMARYKPEVFKRIDGFSSHSYPNPGFSQPPSSTNRMGTATYKYEYEFISQIAGSNKPVFITETGWDAQKVSEETIAQYYQQTFTEIWGPDADKIVAITPFLLKSHGGFDQFSFYKNGERTKYYDVFFNQTKVAGTPIIQHGQLATQLPILPSIKGIDSNVAQEVSSPLEMSMPLKEYFKTILGI